MNVARWQGAIVIGTGALVVAASKLRLLRRLTVEGDSMLRAFRPGDRLLLESLTYRRRPPRIGEVVVVRQSGGGERLDLKRSVAGPGSTVTVRGEACVLGPDEWFVLGDNLDESTDSRQLGPVSRQDIVGRVWCRYYAAK